GRQARTAVSRLRFPLAIAAVVMAGLAAGVLITSDYDFVFIAFRRPGVRGASTSNRGPSEPAVFKQVGRDGPVFTVSVPRARSEDEDYLVKVAQQISDEEKNLGASGQVSVMIWHDDVPVPQ